jgi:hypothetical protein
MGEAARQECPEGRGRALDEEEQGTSAHNAIGREIGTSAPRSDPSILCSRPRSASLDRGSPPGLKGRWPKLGSDRTCGYPGDGGHSAVMAALAKQQPATRLVCSGE